MQLEILTPEEQLYKGLINYIELPGIDGYFGILEKHAPMIAALGEGKITIDQEVEANKSIDPVYGGLIVDLAKDKRFSFDIKGGMVEVQNNKVMVLLD